MKSDDYKLINFPPTEDKSVTLEYFYKDKISKEEMDFIKYLRDLNKQFYEELNKDFDELLKANEYKGESIKEKQIKNIEKISNGLLFILENEPREDNIEAICRVLTAIILNDCRPGRHYYLLDQIYNHIKHSISLNVERSEDDGK